jgi:hypothetical protein
LLQVTKTLAAYQIGKAQTFSQLFSDGTRRRQTTIQNIIIGMLTDGGYKAITLSTSIIAENETSESLVSSIPTCFKESGLLLEDWQMVTKEMNPLNEIFLEMIPSAEDLTLAKLANNGMVMVDTCNTARSFDVC